MTASVLRSQAIAFAGAIVVALPVGASPAQDHRDAVLRLVSISTVLREEARAVHEEGMLGIDLHSPMAAECADFFQDVLSMRRVEVVSTGSGKWRSVAAGAALPNLDPEFRQWQDDKGRHLDGYLVVRWRAQRELLLRVRRTCSDDSVKCAKPAFEKLDVHDSSESRAACSVRRVASRDGQGWQGKLMPMLLDLPGVKRGPPQVFPVDPLRLPAHEPLR
jgi:hypothetical protein